MNRICLLLVISVTFSAGGCMRHQAQYRPLVPTIDPAYSQELVQKADNCAFNAVTAQDLATCLNQYETVIAGDPTNYDAHIALGHLYLLWGDGYLTSKSSKADAFKRALDACVQAMYRNKHFRDRVIKGATPWEAAGTLTKREVDALVFWATAVFYYYKECLGPLGQMINYPWIQRARIMLERAEELDPQWGGGIIPLSWGLYYLSLPEVVGGDREKSAHYFKEAIRIGPDRPVNYWARAKYFHVKMGNRDAFVRDLRRVIDQDPVYAEGHMAWKRFFIADAKRLLADIDQLFSR